MRSGRLNEDDARSPLRLKLVMVALPFGVVGREGWTEITEARRIVSHVFSGARESCGRMAAAEENVNVTKMLAHNRKQNAHERLATDLQSRETGWTTMKEQVK